MKTIDDIADLACIHPAIELGLKAIGSGSVSKEAALIEMVCHLAENLALFKDRADMTEYKKQSLDSLGLTCEEPEQLHESSVSDIAEPTAEPFFLRHVDNHEEQKPDITFKDRLKDRIQPHRLPDLSEGVKKKRGWPW